MRCLRRSAVTALFLLACPAFSQIPAFTIVNYRVIAEQVSTPTQVRRTYRADLVNPGPAFSQVTATVASLNPFQARVMPGQGSLTFSSVSSGGQATSNDTFTLLVDTATTVNFSALKWTFQTSGGPVANAGPNQSVAVGSTVTLNGTGSLNPSGIGTLNYYWSFVSLPPGSNTFIARSSSAIATFIVDVPGTYIIALDVSNGLDTSRANITVGTGKAAPGANAGPYQVLAPGATAVLDGSKSTSAAGNSLTYAWTFVSRPPGSAAALTGANTVSPRFTIDVIGSYVIQLIVNDGQPSAPATVTISTSATVPRPTANAGSNQFVAVGALVQLTGATSFDPGGQPLTYKWTFVSVPEGSAAALSNSMVVSPSFKADRSGIYVAQLIVGNGVMTSIPATVTITTQAQLSPVSNAGSNQTVKAGTMVTLNGSGADPQNFPLTYQWSLLNKPPLSTATLSNTKIARPTFVADLPGAYVAQLIVNNGAQNSAPATVTVTATGTSSFLLPSGVNLAPGQFVPFPVTLAAPTAGNVFLFLDSSDTSKVRISTNTLLIPAGLQSASRVPTITGMAAGSVTITASAYGMPNATVTVNVAPGGAGGSGGSGGSGNSPSGISVFPANLTVNGLISHFLTLTLNAPAPSGGLSVSLSSSNPSAAIVPGTVTFAANATSASVPVTPIAPGFSTVTAIATGMASVTAAVTVVTASETPKLFAPASSTVGSAQSTAWPISLSTPAPAGGVSITLASSDTGKVSVTPNTFIAAGATTPDIQPKVTGIGLGAATVKATAPGYSEASGQVMVVATSGSSFFLPGKVNVNAGENEIIALILSGNAPPGLTTTLTSSNPAIFTVPVTLPLSPGTSTNLAVTGVAAGAATLTAVTPGFGNISIQVTVIPNSSNISATWYGACWQPATIYSITGNFQAISFAISAPAPVTFQGSLFFTADCSGGPDNMNDYGSLTGNGRHIQGFTHNPDIIPSSALYWVGPLTADGRCPPGAPCSGCVKYNQSTPNCNSLP